MLARWKTVVVMAALAALLVAANFRASEAQMPGGGQFRPLTMVLEGNYRVQFDCAFLDKTGSKGKMELVNKIEFHPEYVVLIDQNGAGQLIPVHAIKTLTWEKS